MIKKADQRHNLGFSLVEVVLALGICTFVLIALIGLFSSGWRTSRESEDQIQAANLASRFITVRMAAPTDGPATQNGIPFAKMSQPYGNAFTGTDNYVTSSGQVSASYSPEAAYRITCNVGTNAEAGPTVSQVYLRLSWPPQSSGTNEVGRYEVLTYVPLP